MIRFRSTKIALSLVMMVVAVAPVARAANGGDAVTACYQNAGNPPGAGARPCRSALQVVKGLGRACRQAVAPETCENVDGRLVSEALLASYEQSWAPRALALQRGLDDTLPLQEELWVHTHNTFNAEAYSATLSGMDTNQVYSITDQLRMGVRAIEIDAHWAPSAEAEPGDGGKAPIACHGQSQGSGSFIIHIGCTAEVHLRTRLTEVRAWLDANPGEIVMLYLENQLDGNALAHQRAAEATQQTLGSLVYRPVAAGGACDALPMDMSRAQLRATGKRIILTGNCGPSGPGGWTSWVFDRGPRWVEGGSPVGIDYPDYPACVASQRGPRNYAQNWIRWFEDSTWLSTMVSGTGIGSSSEVPAEEARRMTRCGVNMIGFDQLKPFDAKLDAVIWSWAPNEPATDGCAFLGPDGRFHSGACTTARAFACVNAGLWTIATAADQWTSGQAACAANGAAFSVPRTGYENELLKSAAGGADVWLNYHHNGSSWVAGA